MNNQRGFVLPSGVTLYVVVAALIAFAGLSLAVAYYKNSAARADAEAKTARLERDQYRANWQASEKERAIEQARAEIFEAVGNELEKEKNELKDQNKRDVAAARAGALKLRVPGACPANRAEANPASGERNDATAGELPREITGDLLSLANDADEVVKQLSACQNTIRGYLK